MNGRVLVVKEVRMAADESDSRRELEGNFAAEHMLIARMHVVACGNEHLMLFKF